MKIRYYAQNQLSAATSSEAGLVADYAVSGARMLTEPRFSDSNGPFDPSGPCSGFRAEPPKVMVVVSIKPLRKEALLRAIS
jgi:hypothetical protein